MLLALVLVLGMFPFSALAEEALPMVSIEADKTEVREGETVTLTMKLDKDVSGKVSLWQFNFIWDATYFEATSATVGNAAQSVYPDDPDMAVNPIVNYLTPTTKLVAPYTCATVTHGNNIVGHYLKAGTVATLTLTAKQDVPADTNTKFYVDYVGVYNGQGTPLDVASGDPTQEWGSDYNQVPADNVGIPVAVNKSVAVSGITLDKTSHTMLAGESFKLTATVDPESATDKTVTWSSSNRNVATVEDGVVTALEAGDAVITAKAGEFTATCAVKVYSSAPVYTVTMGEDKSVVVKETVTVPVTVGHTTDVQIYNAFDMIFSYDASVLELTSTDSEGMTVTPGEGTVRVQGYGADRAVGTVPFSLAFKAVGAGEAKVTVISAKVDISANAVEFDAPEAALLDAETVITVSGYPVTLPDNFSGDPVAAPGEDYTFSEPDDYYDYTVTVTVGGQVVEVIDNGDGSYTIPGEKVTGEIVVTAEKTGKKFNVTLGTDMTGEPQAQYMVDYTATLTAAEGFTYEVSVTVGGEVYTGYTVTEGVYTIPGADITGDIVFTVIKTEIPKAEFSVTFEGSGAGDATGEATVLEGSDYTFTLNKAEGYTYTVTAVMGEDKQEVSVTEADGKYTIAKVTGNLVITIGKEAELNVEVSQYVELNGKTVFLVTVTGAQEEGKAFIYDGNAMFYSEVYESWCWLVVVEGEFGVDAAKANIAVTETSYTALAATTDVNMSNAVDINDAQLVYDIYNGKYEDFSVVVMQKFLNADVNGDKIVNVADAAAVVEANQ